MIEAYKNKGISLVELLIAVAVIILLGGTIFVSYRFFEKGAELENTTQNILSALRIAQTKTLASEENSQYGIHFENDKYISFKGSAYNPADPDNKVHQLSNYIEIHNIDLVSGGNDIIFQRISGNVNQNGTTSLRIISQPTKTKTITISPSGRIELDSNLIECCTTNRLTDTRHLHLNLGWSIQTSNVLTLYFSDAPDVTVDINMANYFDAGKTNFDWTGTIDINGENQKLRIHTHFLDTFNALLCIHRDRDKNNKPLQILIDTQDIISYTADGIAVVGAFGGAMEIE